jgi:hypothetical protein
MHNSLNQRRFPVNFKMQKSLARRLPTLNNLALQRYKNNVLSGKPPQGRAAPGQKDMLITHTQANVAVPSAYEILFPQKAPARHDFITKGGYLFPLFWWGKNHFITFPVYWQKTRADGGHNRLLFPLAWNWDSDNGVGPVWWKRGEYVHLAPLYWQWKNKADDGHNRVLFPLAWNWDGDNGVGPVWWGKDYLNVFPFFWNSARNWMLLPLAWDVGGNRGAGPVWWKRGDYFRAFPLYWQWKNAAGTGSNRLVLPLAWSWNGHNGVVPVWWKRDAYFRVFPLYWQWKNKDGDGNDRLLFPLAWGIGGHNGVANVWWKDGDYFRIFPIFWGGPHGFLSLAPPVWHTDAGDNGVFPVCWGRDYFHIFPLLWTSARNWLVFPLTWSWDGHNGFTNVWWKRNDYFRAFPLYWQWRNKAGTGANGLLLPLAWNIEGHKGIGPVAWNAAKGYLRVFPLFWKHNRDWLFLPLAWRSGDATGILPLHVSWKNDKGASRTILPLLLGWSTREQGRRSTHFLGYFINHESTPDGYTFQIQPILQVKGGRTGQFAIFWRLLEHGRDEDGDTYWRFLYIPHKFGSRKP